MVTFTREQLIEEAKYNLEHCFCSEKTKVLMDIAIATLAAKPVGLFAHRAGVWIELCQGDMFDHPDGTPLFSGINLEVGE